MHEPHSPHEYIALQNNQKSYYLTHIEARGRRPGPDFRKPADDMSVTRFADAHSSSQRPAIDWQHSSSQLPVTIMTPTGSSPGGRFA
jgi:hypothetical protein